MTRIRRIATGHDGQGKAIIASDEQIELLPQSGVAGWSIVEVWGADETLAFPDSGAMPAFSGFFSPVGGFRCRHVAMAPHTVPNFEEPEHGALDNAPPADIMGSDGMHRSESVDMIYVIAGRCVLELDKGTQVTLNAGDTLVQSGTTHAWSNPFDEECRMVAVNVGAIQKPR